MRHTPAAGGDERDRRVISQSRTDVQPVLDHWRAPLVAVPMIHEGTALGLITASRRENDGIVEVSVADTGVGIAPEDQQTIFEEFRQVGAVDKRVEGTALAWRSRGNSSSPMAAASGSRAGLDRGRRSHSRFRRAVATDLIGHTTRGRLWSLSDGPAIPLRSMIARREGRRKVAQRRPPVMFD